MERDVDRLPVRAREPRKDGDFDLDDLLDLFNAAFEHRFCQPLPEARLHAYVQRYLRFGLVPPWVRGYVQRVLGGIAPNRIGQAPLDPVFDLRLWLWQLSTATVFWARRQPEFRTRGRTQLF